MNKNNELKVQLRGGFSDRLKINPLNAEMQVDDLDERTRNKLANLFKGWCDELKSQGYVVPFFDNFINDVYGEFVDDDMVYRFEYRFSESYEKYIREPITNKSCYDVLTISEYITRFISRIFQRIDNENAYYTQNRHEDCELCLNNLFQEEFVGYRMIDNEITPITDEIEIKEIQDSLDIQFEGCKSHIRKALSLLSDRENPDYKNSIKESISAVESICQLICKDDSATLGKALNRLERNGIKIHKALKEAYSKLYGYTSDEDGIRHAEGMFESNVSFEEAKYFLVSCCAFLNYLIAEYGKQKDGGDKND